MAGGGGGAGRGAHAGGGVQTLICQLWSAVELCGPHVSFPLSCYGPLTAHMQVEAFKQSKQSEFELLESSLDAAEAAVRAEQVKNT